MAKVVERVKFSLIQMPCCRQVLCWVNPRLPNYCPECGVQVWISAHRECIVFSDDTAFLQIEDPRMKTG